MDAERIKLIQALEQEAYKFCAKSILRLYQFDIRAKSSDDFRYSAHAALCKNDIYAILQLSMTSFIRPSELPYSTLITVEPDLKGISLSNEAIEFIVMYKTTLNPTMTREEALEDYLAPLSGGRRRRTRRR